MEMGDRIKQLRLAAGLTQEQLGRMVGVKKCAVSKWEKGIVDNLSYDRLSKLAEIFHVTCEFLKNGINREKEDYSEDVIILGETKPVPLYGPIACGQPILAANIIEGYVHLPKDTKADFALTCKGDSMINARIFDGDIVYIRKQDQVENGEIAAVRVDNEATLKRFYHYDNYIVLKPENPKYEDRMFWNEEMEQVHILGKAIAFSAEII